MFGIHYKLIGNKPNPIIDNLKNNSRINIAWKCMVDIGFVEKWEIQLKTYKSNAKRSYRIMIVRLRGVDFKRRAQPFKSGILGFFGI